MLRQLRQIRNSVDGHVPDIGDRSGDVQTGLWEQCAGQSSGSPDTPLSVGPERFSLSDLLTLTLRPHHKCDSQLALTAHSAAHRLQDSRTGVQSYT